LAYLEDDFAKNILNVIEEIGQEGLYKFKDIFIQKFNSISSTSGKSLFLESFFKELNSQYGKDEHFAFCLDAITILLRRGIERWKYPLFKFLGGLLMSSSDELKIMKEEMVHLTQLVLYYCNSSNERLAVAAQEIVPSLISYLQPEVIPLKLLNFLRKASPGLYSSKKPNRFLGDTRSVFNENLIQNIGNIYKFIFGLTEESPSFKLIETKLGKPLILPITQQFSMIEKTSNRRSLLPEKGKTLSRLMHKQLKEEELQQQMNENKMEENNFGTLTRQRTQTELYKLSSSNSSTALTPTTSSENLSPRTKELKSPRTKEKRSQIKTTSSTKSKIKRK